jgi:hypothetical protein
MSSVRTWDENETLQVMHKKPLNLHINVFRSSSQGGISNSIQSRRGIHEERSRFNNRVSNFLHQAFIVAVVQDDRQTCISIP